MGDMNKTTTRILAHPYAVTIYRACYYSTGLEGQPDVVLTTPAEAGLSDAQLLARALDAGMSRGMGSRVSIENGLQIGAWRS